MNPSLAVARRFGAQLLLALTLLPHAVPAQGKKPEPASALLVSAIAGQSVPVLPLTYLVVNDSVHDAAIPAGRVARLAWADSILAEAILARAPEVTWVLGAELRRKARAAPGMLPTPDRLGQAALRFTNIKRLPDPLFGYLRTLVAVADGRMVLVPASVRFTREDSLVRAETMFVLADGRGGAVIWRSAPAGYGKTAAEALTATVNFIFPDAH